ncbi:DUF3800 domain-containing protein [Chloroflexota bacterium]
MKFCYIDESGIDQEKPFAVMAGIIVDANRMHITKTDWSDLLQILSGMLPRPIKEIHTSDFYSGNGPWRSIDGQSRARIIDIIFNWLNKRKHEIVYTAVDRINFISQYHTEAYFREVPTLWRFMALHICLAIQKQFKTYTGNKGHAVLIFDKQETESAEFIKLIMNPPEWTDTYYQRQSKEKTFYQLVDVPYFGDSKHIGLIQLADFVSFFLRKHIELQMEIPPDYEEEPSLINKWATVTLNQAIPTSAIYPKIGRCECADLFYRYAPDCLR